MRDRLVAIQSGLPEQEALADNILTSEEMEADLLDEWLDIDEPEENVTEAVDPLRLRKEIEELDQLAKRARSIGTDTKTRALLKALEIGFAELAKMGAFEKAIIFTEFSPHTGVPTNFP